MKIEDALQGVGKLFLDTAPVIYFVETHPLYIDALTAVFDHIDSGAVTAVTSPVTLAECLVVPIRQRQQALQQDFIDLITRGQNTLLVPIDRWCGEQAAQLRANHNLRLADALQVAAALSAGCDAFLTNDKMLRRITTLRILVVEELELNAI